MGRGSEPTQRKGWLRDEAGRRYYVESDIRVYEKLEDRDAAIEERYTLGCDCCRSLLMAVTRHTDELLCEYMAWGNAQMAPHVVSISLLHEWLRVRFGARAYPSVHGLMFAAVKHAVFGDPYASLAKRPKRPGTGVQEMPRPRLSNREWNDARNAAAARERDLPRGDRSE